MLKKIIVFLSINLGIWLFDGNLLSNVIVAFDQEVSKSMNCCLGIRGNVDNDPEDICDISDLVYLVDFMFTSGLTPVCLEEANVDGDIGNIIDISDLVYLVDFMFTDGPAPKECSPYSVVFTPDGQILGDTRSFSVVIEDIDLDNDDDIFYANYVGQCWLWLNNGNGQFTPSNQTFDISEVHGAGIKDLNGDNFPDIFLLSHTSSSKIYFNNGAGGFTDSEQNIGSADDFPGMIILEDLDSDNDIDAFIIAPSIPNRIWFNNGYGFFTLAPVDYGGSSSSATVFADFNGDTFPDFYMSMRDLPDEVWLNDGSGNFTKTGQSFGIDLAPDLDSKDIDNDGDFDIIILQASGIQFLINQNNTGTFNVFNSNIEPGALRCCLLDADLDGDYDLISSHPGGAKKLWLNDSAGSFTFHSDIPNSNLVFSIAYSDLDADGDYDLVFGGMEGGGGNKIYINDLY